MIALRVVFDTNAIVSAVLSPSGTVRTALTLAMKRPARLYYSADVLAEYEEVLARPKLKLIPARRQQVIDLIETRGHLVQPKYHVEACSDPEDDIFLECAEAARADYLITGNAKHFPALWRSTKIISAADFVSLTAPHLLR